MSGILRWKVAQFAERRWWRNYLKKKEPRDYLLWKKQYWQDFHDKFREHIDLQANSKIADLGCGPAGIFILFPEHDVVAVDPLIEAYSNDLPHFNTENYPKVKFVNSSIEDFQESEKFDTVYCINAINHVRDLQLGYQRLVECTKKGGKIILSIDAHNHRFLKKIFQLLPGDILHPHQYELKEYETFCKEAGCQILESLLLDEAFIFNYYVIVLEKL